MSALLSEVLKKWEQNEKLDGLVLDDSLYAPALRDAVDAAWSDPSTDSAVKQQWEEVFPGVYKAQFFDPEKLHVLRGYMDKAAKQTPTHVANARSPGKFKEHSKTLTAAYNIRNQV